MGRRTGESGRTGPEILRKPFRLASSAVGAVAGPVRGSVPSARVRSARSAARAPVRPDAPDIPRMRGRGL